MKPKGHAQKKSATLGRKSELRFHRPSLPYLHKHYIIHVTSEYGSFRGKSLYALPLETTFRCQCSYRVFAVYGHPKCGCQIVTNSCWDKALRPARARHRGRILTDTDVRYGTVAVPYGVPAFGPYTAYTAVCGFAHVSVHIGLNVCIHGRVLCWPTLCQA